MSLVDTSVAIDGLQYGEPRAEAISIITLLELLRGVAGDKRAELKRHLEDYYPVIEMDNKSVLEYCRLYQLLRARGEMIPEADLIIAATAVSKGLELVTSDSHFLRLQGHGLKLRLIGAMD